MADVKDVMVKEVITVDSRDTVLKAAELMSDYDVGCLVVEDGGEAAGAITESDIISKVVVRKKDPRITQVKDVMSSPLVTIHPLTSLEGAVEVFNETGYKRLAVSSGESLEGILSIEDLITEETKFIQVLEKYIEILKSKN
ncbi:MAG: CBS domain-containing protein [Candidatus Altiarchaeota archaeon]|nr:CBS domain-containing protein [Candidatus Altiarchaeota archaeon]